jgi:aldose 1-epimerase
VLTYSIQNIGETAMPMVLGWHPYFKIDGEKADDWQLELPATHQYISDSQMIPADKKAVNFEGLIQIKEHVLDNVFAVATSSKVTAILHSPTQDIALHIWQEALAGQFNFMVVYIPPARDCIAIEPMTGNTDAYNSGDGLLTLAVGACYEVSCGVFIA